MAVARVREGTEGWEMKAGSGFSVATPTCVTTHRKDFVECGGCRVPHDASKPFRLVKVGAECKECVSIAASIKLVAYLRSRQEQGRGFRVQGLGFRG